VSGPVNRVGAAVVGVRDHGADRLEQRYQAVLEVDAGVPVVEVAQRFGVSRQAVHRWVAATATAAWKPWPIGRSD
jgi:transposase